MRKTFARLLRRIANRLDSKPKIRVKCLNETTDFDWSHVKAELSKHRVM